MIRFGILDDDVRYSRQLADFFSARFGNQAEPHLFHSAQALADYLQKGRLNLVLASPELLPDPAEVPSRTQVAYLADEPDIEQILGRPAVFRYQRGEALLRRLKGLAAEADSRGVTFSSSRQGALFVLLGAGGGAGCTTAAIGCAAALARRGVKTLFLPLQNNGYIGDCLPSGGAGNMSKVLYEVKSYLGDTQRQGNLALKLEGLLKYDNQLQLHYYDPFPLPLEAASMTAEELELLLRTAAGLFDAVVADMDGVFSPLLRAAGGQAEQIILVSDGSQGTNCRLNQMFETLSLLDESEGANLLSKAQVLYSRFGSRGRRAQLAQAVPVLGTIDNFSGSDSRTIAAEVAGQALFQPLAERCKGGANP